MLNSGPTLPSRVLLECTVTSPFPPSFDLQPVVTQRHLVAFGQYRWFYTIAVVQGCLFLVEFYLSPYTPTVFHGIMQPLIVLAVLVWMLASLTRMDSRILRQLLLSFEWWWLLGNTLLYIVCMFVDSPFTYVASPMFIMLLSMLFTISLDAVVDSNRWGRGLLLLCTVLGLINLMRAPSSNPVFHPICLLYCTSTHSLRGGALTTLAIFTAKYLAFTLFKPQHLLIVSTRVQCGRSTASEADSASDGRADSTWQEHSSVQTMQLPLLEQRALSVEH
jgi:hypothetical protein